MDTNTETVILYSDIAGRLRCAKHLDAEASALLAQRPNAKNLRTPSTIWVRWGKGEYAACLLRSFRPACEACGATPV